jgi:hypothetical protein
VVSLVFQLDFVTVPTVWISCFSCCNSFKTYQKNKKHHTVGTVPKSNSKTRDITLSEQLQNLTEKQKISHCRNSSKIYQKNKKHHTVGTVSKPTRKIRNTTLSEQFQNLPKKQQISHSRNSSKIKHKHNKYHTV